MACGLPIISTPAGGVVDIVFDNQNGYLVGYDAIKISNAIVKLVSDKNVRKKIEETCLKRYGTTCSSKSDKVKEKTKALIVTQMYPVIKHIAKTIARRAYDPIEDLVQAGFIGLLKAIDRYNKKRNDNFRVYAGYLIIGEMKHFLRDQLDTIRVPRHIQELSIRIHNFIQTLTPEEVQNLTSDKVATALDIPKKAIDFVMQVERRKETLSLEEIFRADNNRLNYEDMLFVRFASTKV
jgi:RNA polymerase sigma factor (sigma-70 family)